MRRKILYYLTEDEGFTRAELAERLAADADIQTRDTAHLEVVLHHTHLPKLDSEQYIEYDSRSGDIIRWEDADVIRGQLHE